MEISTTEVSLIKELLDLSDIEIQEVKLTRDNHVLVRVKSTKEVTDCHQCGRPTQPYGHMVAPYIYVICPC